jgi:hypothetical protein
MRRVPANAHISQNAAWQVSAISGDLFLARRDHLFDMDVRRPSAGTRRGKFPIRPLSCHHARCECEGLVAVMVCRALRGTSEKPMASKQGMGRFRVLQLLPGLFVIASCSRGPRILDRHLTDNELVEQAPIIVVGRIEKLEWLLNERQRHGAESGPDVSRRPLYWHRVNVRMTVENVLRGDLMGSSVEYVYWLPLSAKVGEWNSLMERARYVHFLRREGPQLRAFVDFWPSAIRVTTGRHQSIPQAGGLQQRIARMLLEPGEDFDVTRFNIVYALRDGGRLVGWSAALALARTGDPRIRLQACERR